MEIWKTSEALVYWDARSWQKRFGIIRDDPLPQRLEKLWTRCNNGYGGPSEDELTALLREVTRDGPTYIVIDALDECAVQFQTRFLDALGVDDGDANFLVTSRYLDVLEDGLEDFTKSQIEANYDDLNLFIDYKIRTEHQLRMKLEDDKNLEFHMKHQVRDKCNGIFLLATIHMQSLAMTLDRKEFIELLSRLSTEVNDTYMLALTRIECMEANKRKLALDSLCWIIYAQRQLTIRDLQYALTADPFDTDSIVQPEELLSLLEGLVTILDNKVGLVHYTAVIFLKYHLKNKVSDFDAVITQTCINHLSISALELNMSPWTYKFDYPFLLYAGAHLHYHLQQVSESHGLFNSIFGSLKDLLTNRQKRKFLRCLLTETEGSQEGDSRVESLPGLNLYDSTYEDSRQMFVADPRRRSFAAFDEDEEEKSVPSSDAGVEEDLSPLIVNDKDRKEDSSQLLDEDQDENEAEAHPDEADSSTPPLAPSSIVAGTFTRSRHQMTDDNVPSILSRSNKPEEYSALYMATFLVEVLMRNDQATPVPGDSAMFVRTALFLATEHGDLETVRVLLEYGPIGSVRMRGLNGATLLHRAAWRNYADLVELLLDKAADPNAQDDLGQTPWSQNFRLEFKDVLQALLRGGANPNERDPEGRSTLYFAAAGGHLANVKLNLECGVDPSMKTACGWTPLHWAASNGHFHCVQALLDAGAEPSTVSDQSVTPLDMVQGRPDRLAIRRILRDAGAMTMSEIPDKKASNLTLDNS
ncbi:hypothetical protein KCU67_g1212, partial [Aureobasidium melanogenum]